MSFYEAFWHGKGIGDGADLQEALQSYLVVKVEDLEWAAACAKPGANPHIDRYRTFDEFLDNADPLEVITIRPDMIEEALKGLLD